MIAGQSTPPHLQYFMGRSSIVRVPFTKGKRHQYLIPACPFLMCVFCSAEMSFTLRDGPSSPWNPPFCNTLAPRISPGIVWDQCIGRLYTLVLASEKQAAEWGANQPLNEGHPIQQHLAEMIHKCCISQHIVNAYIHNDRSSFVSV